MLSDEERIEISMRPQITHPPVFGESNVHVLDTITTAYRAALKLAEKGFVITSVFVGERNPIIWVMNSVECGLFEKAIMISRHVPEHEIIYATNYCGCQVQWRVIGH